MQEQFEHLRASELFCPRCKTAQPVREKLLLVLPGKDLYDYVCSFCGTSLGSREVKQGPKPAVQSRPKQPPRGLLG